MSIFRGGLWVAPVVVLLAGCGVGPITRSTTVSAVVSGRVSGGQQPVSGATIQLYEVGTAADGSAATALLTPGVTTDANGNFSISTLYTCSPTTSLVYLVATGGNPGLSSGAMNPNLAEMAALGPCNLLTTSTLVIMNEVTTVAAVAAQAPFMSGYSAVGSGTYDTANLLAAFNLAAEYANVTTGSSPGTGVPAGYTAPTAEINTLANVLSACINSAGGQAGDSTLCGQLFTLLTPPNGVAPTDTVGALVNLMNNPSLNTTSVFGLSSSTPAFQPQLSSPPATFAVMPVATGTVSLQFSAASVTFPATAVGFTTAVQTVTITNSGQGTVNFTDFSLTGTNTAEFTQASDCTTLAVGASCQLQVTSTPAAAGTRTATVNVPSTASGAAQTLALSVLAGAPAAGPVTVSPSSLNFTVSGTAQDVTLTNNGTGPLTIKLVSVTYNEIQGNTCVTMLAAQSSCTITVQNFSGTSTTPGVLTINDDAAAGPQTVTVTAANTMSVLNSVNLFYPGGVGYGEESERAITVSSYNNSQIASFTGTVTGADPGDFFQYNPSTYVSSPLTGCTAASAGAACSFYINFVAGAPGLRTAKLGPATGYLPLVASGDGVGAGPNIALVGSTYGIPYIYSDANYANQIEIMSSTVDAATDVSSGTATVSIYNNGSSNANITAFPIFAANASYFSASGSCANLAPGTNCTVTIAFHAKTTVPGTYQGKLVVQDTVSGTSQSLPIYVSNALNASPSSFDFQNTPTGTTSAGETITITDSASNGSPDPLTVTVAAPFQVTTPVCTGGSSSPVCAVTVTLAPGLSSAIGTFNTYLSVTDTVTGTVNAYAASFSGNVIAPLNAGYVSVASALNFGAQPAGGTPDTITIHISNFGGIPVTLGGISIVGATNGNFTETNSCPATLAAYPFTANSCTISVTFAPTATGAQSATLQILSNAANSPNIINLLGTGQ